MGSDVACWSQKREGPRPRPRHWCPQESFKLQVRWGCGVWVLWYTPRRGYHPHQFLMDTGGTLRLEKSYPPTDTRKMKKRQISASAAGAPSHLAAMETNLFGKHLNIVKHLAITKYEDGSPRTPGTLMLKTMGTAYVITLKEPDAMAELPITAASLDDAVALADLLLGGDDAPWQIDRWATSRAPKKRN